MALLSSGTQKHTVSGSFCFSWTIEREAREGEKNTRNECIPQAHLVSECAHVCAGMGPAVCTHV